MLELLAEDCLEIGTRDGRAPPAAGQVVFALGVVPGLAGHPLSGVGALGVQHADPRNYKDHGAQVLAAIASTPREDLEKAIDEGPP